MSHELGDGLRMGIAKVLVIKVFREDSRLLNLAKCHSPLLLGLLEIQFCEVFLATKVKFIFISSRE